jgi:hypothetical protein
MNFRILRRTGFALLAFGAALTADTQFRIRQMTRNDVPLGKGQCDIRLQIDGEAEVSVRGDMVYIRTISGRDGRDDGSECNQPLPPRNVDGFNFEVKDSRGDIRLLSDPSRRSDGQAIVRIRDSAGGEGRYHFRISWNMAGTPGFGDRGPGDRGPDRRRDDFPDERRGGGLAWNNTFHYGGQGRGTSSLSGYGSQRLFDTSVDIDRGGRLLVTFRTDSGRSLSFSGTVMNADRDTIRADVSTDDRARLRGTMVLSRDYRGEVSRISLDATDGRDHLRLDWDRR